MAKAERKSVVTKKTNKSVEWDFPMNSKNLMIFGGGVLIIVLGYLAMSTGLQSEYANVEGAWNSPLAVTVAPFMLVVGYCVVIPYSILTYFKKNEIEKNS
jgi:NADH:ubiquinone oxidoreductase subunit 6 (subunit J)